MERKRFVKCCQRHTLGTATMAVMTDKERYILNGFGLYIYLAMRHTQCKMYVGHNTMSEDPRNYIHVDQSLPLRETLENHPSPRQKKTSVQGGDGRGRTVPS